MGEFPICIVKKEEPNAGWVEYDCGSCDGTLKNANCGGEYYKLETDTTKPRLFYWEEGLDAWVPVPDLVENIISTDNLENGDIESIRFKRVDMTDAEYAAIPGE